MGHLSKNWGCCKTDHHAGEQFVSSKYRLRVGSLFEVSVSNPPYVLSLQCSVGVKFSFATQASSAVSRCARWSDECIAHPIVHFWDGLWFLLNFHQSLQLPDFGSELLFPGREGQQCRWSVDRRWKLPTMSRDLLMFRYIWLCESLHYFNPSPDQYPTLPLLFAPVTVKSFLLSRYLSVWVCCQQARLRAMEALDAKKAIERQLKQVGVSDEDGAHSDIAVWTHFNKKVHKLEFLYS